VPVTTDHLKLTYEGAAKILAAALAKAEELAVPQCVAVTDDGGHLLAFARMDGAKVLSIDSATAKARTASSSRVPTGNLAEGMDWQLTAATRGRLTNLKGGFPIIVQDHLVGAIGVGSGTAEEDIAVAEAGVAALSQTQPPGASR
jgi:glc operon protein GlcG